MGEVSECTAEVYFSYQQIFVFDASVTLPGCAWETGHYRQGFARRNRNLCVGTMLEFGHAVVTIRWERYEAENAPRYERAIEVPFEVSSGEVAVGGPEEFENEHMFPVAPGHYRLVVAQLVIHEDREAIDLYFEMLGTPLERSRILVRDAALDPPTPLLESAEVA